MELYQLQCFLAAAKRGNFSRAAEDVHISQPSISKIISRLEKELGVPLFERKNGRIYLNANGIIFQKYVDIALQSLEDGVALMHTSSEVAKNTIRIGCTASLRFDSILEEVQSQLPQCLLQIEVMHQEALVNAFEQGEVDIGFLESDKSFSSPLFEEIDKQYFVVHLTDKHPAAKWERFPPERLAEEIVCFTGQEDDKRFLIHMFASEGIRPRVFAEYPDHKATAQLINTGSAIGIVPDELYYHRKRSTPELPLYVLPISGSWYRWIYMFHRTTDSSPKEVEQVYCLLRDRFRKERQTIQAFYREQGIDFSALPH